MRCVWRLAYKFSFANCDLVAEIFNISIIGMLLAEFQCASFVYAFVCEQVCVASCLI